MKSFTTGLVAGAVIAAGLAMVAHPFDKRDMRRLKNTSRRAMRGINRTINRWT